MWSYYGGKTKLVHHYPTPKEDLIIEPFAGSARYALEYWERDVLLVDKYDIVVKLWKWLQQCSPKDILSLPIPKVGDKIKREDFECDEQFWLMGFSIANGTSSPQQSVSPFGVSSESYFKHKIEKYVSHLPKIKHWKIIQGSFEDIPNQKATWYIDPPYQFGGEHYKESNKNIDFEKLGKWCESREGQVIVCENTKADWMDFKPMVQFNGLKKTTTEAIWSNQPTAFDHEQLTMF